MSFNGTRIFRKPVGIKPKYPVAMRPNKYGVMKLTLEGETLRMFKKLFPLHSNRRIAAWFGLSFTTIQRFKRELGLEKNMKAVCREHARDIKRTCEANGYYASLRGKRPSDACIEGARRLRASGFSPLRYLKQTAPARFRATMKKRGESLKATWRKEYLREAYGLDRQTNLRIAPDRISTRAQSYKYVMKRDCNYFYDPDDPRTVLYDNETRRDPRREKRAAERGLRVLPADDYSNAEAMLSK